MATKQTQPVELTIGREIGAQAKLFVETKSDVRIGWEGASRPEVLESVRAHNERQVDATAAALLARFS